jgi:hypothetical protein
MPMIIGSLVLVLVMALLSALVWVWAVRKPLAAPATPAGDATSDAPRLLSYVAIGNANVNTLFGSKPAPVGSGWVAQLLAFLPPDTHFFVAGEDHTTLRETNLEVIPAIKANPDIITLWNVVGDSTGGTPLIAYLAELRKALDRLTGDTDAQVVLLNLPDLTLLMQDQTEERKALVRGGIEQWNRVIAEAALRYGRRVLLIDLYPISAQVLDPVTGNTALAEMVWHEVQATENAKRKT